MDIGAASLEPSGAGSGSLIRAVVAQSIAPDVERIDRHGFYPRDGLRALGEAGAFSNHLAAHTALPRRSIAAAVRAMAAVGETCMSTAFCVWCQDTCGWYLEQTPNQALRERLQPGIASGDTLGGTGLSNPVKALAGIESFRLRGTRVEGGWCVTGVLPWVSNLGGGHWFGTVFDAGDRRVMAMFCCGQNNVEIRQNVHFVALEGTATYSIRFRRAFLPDADVLADPIDEIMPRIRPGFVLLQTGMGFGVIAGAAAQMRHDDVSYAHTNRYLPYGASFFEDEGARLTDELADLADRPGSGRDYMRAVLGLRLAVSELTLAATQAGVLHGGARGYLESSGIERRQREGNFVALITPSIRHLRQEIAALSST
ncbi:MAG: acyl-CoA dehydrogenase family protein [Acetobacteraceae bacterium]|nr:acyl-CoA dehydrogenase family protein [Acetobacteraceae bacterium]